jgi:hypothetical protein
MAARFGDQIITADGALDAAAVAAIVFNDKDGPRRPERRSSIRRCRPRSNGRSPRTPTHRSGGRARLPAALAENPRDGLAATIVVDVDPRSPSSVSSEFPRHGHRRRTGTMNSQITRADRLARRRT